jgi:hypothetical protein
MFRKQVARKVRAETSQEFERPPCFLKPGRPVHR